MWSAFLVLAGLGLLVAAHEAGHALVAKAFGFQVTDFSFGLGPALASRKIGSITWHLGLIPFGGFVRVTELSPLEDGGASAPDMQRFSTRNTIARLAVIGAGSMANFVVAAVLVATVALFWGVETGRVTGLEVTATSTTARASGLLVGDVVLSVASRPIRRVSDLSAAFVAGGGAGGGGVPLVVRRGGRAVELSVRPRSIGDRWGLGARYAPRPELRGVGVLGALGAGLFFPGERALGMLGGWLDVIRPSSEVRPVSAVGLADRVSRSGRWDLRRALLFVAVLSVVVGLFNLVPLPGLDGGRLCLEVVESARRRRLTGRAAVAVQVSGALLLLVCWAFILAEDLRRLW